MAKEKYLEAGEKVPRENVFQQGVRIPSRLKRRADVAFDLLNSAQHVSGRDSHAFEIKLPICLLMDSLELQRVVEADPARSGWLAESEILDEEHLPLVYLMGSDPFHLIVERR